MSWVEKNRKINNWGGGDYSGLESTSNTLQFADFVTFTEEVLNEKLYFLCSVIIMNFFLNEENLT